MIRYNNGSSVPWSRFSSSFYPMITATFKDKKIILAITYQKITTFAEKPNYILNIFYSQNKHVSLRTSRTELRSLVIESLQAKTALIISTTTDIIISTYEVNIYVNNCRWIHCQ